MPERQTQKQARDFSTNAKFKGVSFLGSSRSDHLFSQIWKTVGSAKVTLFMKKEFFGNKTSFTKCKFAGIFARLYSFLNEIGSIKLIVSANFAACFMNLWHFDDWRPNGGFPITWILPFFLGGRQSKKFACFICLFSGAKSKKIVLHFNSFNFLIKLPPPALGSTIKSCFLTLILEPKTLTQKSDISGLV